MGFAKINCYGMLFTLIERNQPHVMIVCCVVHAVEQFVQSAIIRAMPCYRVHISRICLDIRYINRDHSSLSVDDLDSREAYIEEISPCLCNVHFNNSTSEATSLLGHVFDHSREFSLALLRHGRRDTFVAPAVFIVSSNYS